MTAKKTITTKKTVSVSKNTNTKKQTEEQVQAEITRALLGIVAISIFIIFVLAR